MLEKLSYAIAKDTLLTIEPSNRLQCLGFSKAAIGGGPLLSLDFSSSISCRRMPNKFSDKITTLLEVFAFLRRRKKYWLIPLMIVLSVMGLTLVAVQGSAIAPFIYTLF